MMPPRQQPRSGVLHTSLTLVPADGSNSDQIRDSPTESASSRETWPTSDALMLSKQQQLDREKAKERENGSAEHSVIRHISNSDIMSLRDISKERVDGVILVHIGRTRIVPYSMHKLGMGPTVNGGSSGEMLFRCRACLRTSELFGWVKDVFHHCAPLWDREALVRELEYLKSGVAEPLASKAILSFFQEFDIDPTKHQEGGESRLMAPQEAFNRIADVVQEAIKKMEMTKPAKWPHLKWKDRRKKQQVDELEESIVRLKQAEAKMFDFKASEARLEAERLQRIALAKGEKSEEDYESSYLKQRLHEAEAEKHYMFEKMKLESSSRASQSSVGVGVCCVGVSGVSEPSQQMMMYNKIQDLLKSMYTAPSKGDGQSSDIRSLGSV
ncbi:hypothetical protein E3N88_42764 [Mikania micrantha]|uniref:Oberon coiled-coil region domain-containing protein n=1 Tax=Mikania micrantha TaxID=192012 RepID=A0A5N6LGT7_9ASTR|nr:hypothetical protein E3N88_42764 [Mikania micrantha]